MLNLFETAHISASKKRILNSALILFVEKGFFSTSIPDLVRHSGVSTGSIYHAFKDKESLATQLMQHLLETIEAEQLDVLGQHTGVKARYFALVRWMLQFAERYPEAEQFILYARHKEFMPGLAPICSSKPFMILRDVIQEGQDEGVLRPMDVMVASSIAYGSVLRLIQLSLDGVLTTPLMSHFDELTEAAWRALAVETSD
ncbi:MAG: TetR/AcrR family transcriptional regulator [Hydrogenovibrio sp.]